MASGHGVTASSIDLFAFGSRAGPRPPRQNIDYIPDALGRIGPEQPPFPAGASLFSNPNAAPLSGHYHRLPGGTQLPSGFDVIADGIDVHPNSVHPATHHTIFPINEMDQHQFVNLFLALPWQYVGKKP